MDTTVDELCALVGLADFAQPEYQWDEIERSLGLRLPDDYKEIVGKFPVGHFQGFLRVLRPGDRGGEPSEYLGYYSHRLDDMRSWQADESERFPYPVFPESGGLIPWGETTRGDLFFWLTDLIDPNSWPVIVTDYEFSSWQKVSKGLAGFLCDVVTGRFDGQSYGADSASNAPWYRLSAPQPTVTRASVEGIWQDLSDSGERPVNAMQDIYTILPESRTINQSIEWGSIEDRLGITLPLDYKSFVNTFGPGTIGDVTIMAPGARPDSDLLQLIETVQTTHGSDRQRKEKGPPIYPESQGLIPWGRVTGDGICWWAPVSADSLSWGIVESNARMSVKYSPTLSFSSFLLAYMSGRVRLFATGELIRDPISFVPAVD
ncbi:SMI1/KNR4 family protein [Actinophytocola sp. NPDC049390]|uniref:SMI1/KNR4 family protein n=1 Tax=Actinophytocola sp. NPDC049390 TaxID=3363894 RepID=UPI0037ABBE15